MKKRFCRAFALLMACISILSLYSFNAFADEEASQNQTGSICIQYPVDGAAAYLWRIGDYSTDGRITLEGKFAEYNEIMTNEATADAVTLSNLVFGTIAPYTTGVSKNGTVGFSELKRGAYLLYTTSMTDTEGEYYCFTPSIFYLPFAEKTSLGTEESWILQIVVKYVKCSPPKEMTVNKVWTGNSVTRPSGVTVDLYRNGVYQETVTLNAQNKWTYSQPMEPDNCGWTARESTVPSGFTITVSEATGAFTITNTCPTKSSVLPQTGQLWWPVPLLFMAGFAMLTLGVNLRRRKEGEQ